MAIYRPSAKVLLVDPLGRVLLLSGIDRTKPGMAPVWFTVGGAIELGESPDAAAIREAYEETGLVIADPGPVLFNRRFEWTFEGSEFDQEEWYFMVRTDCFEPTPAAWTDVEMATLRGHRWWSIEDLANTSEIVFPEDLAVRLEELLSID